LFPLILAEKILWMKYYIIAGEASGDLHASNLIHEIKKKDPGAQFRGWGGDLMQEEGVHLVNHIKDFSFMGFTEVIRNLPVILKSISFCKKDIIRYNPDALILIDYPGFNLRIAEFAHAKKYKVIYYISPQIWAWKQSRIHKIKATVDKMLVILPFEKDFYQKFGFEVDFVGHPLLDAIENYRKKTPLQNFKQDNHLSDKPIVALLPGSRKQEIARMLKLMLSIQYDFPDVQFVIAGAPSIPTSYYYHLLNSEKVPIITNKTYDLLMHASAALVTSGTATLETALFHVPEVVCYKGSGISYQIAKRLIKVKYISLANLIMDKKIVTELIQNDLNKENINKNLKEILYDNSIIEQMKTDYADLAEKLGGKGASAKAADVIDEYVKRNLAKK
jgi:lipid-A-disaccharide synthase